MSPSDDHQRVRALGRHRRPLPRRDHHLGRTRFHAASAASGCSKSCRTAPASSASILHFDVECDPADPKWRDDDLVIASDGINRASATRSADAFGARRRRARRQVRLARHAQGSSTPSPSPSRRPSTAGSGRTPTASTPDSSTFIVECSEETWRRSASTAWTRRKASPSARACSPNSSTATSSCPTPRTCVGSAAWLNFRRDQMRALDHGNVILLGDAAHTAHFSVGCGTKLALEDAIELAEVAQSHEALSPEARPRRISGRARTWRCSSSRTARATRRNGSRTRSATRISSRSSSPTSLLTRSQRISHENLRLRDREWLEGGRDAGSGNARRTAARTRPRRRCSRPSSCARWKCRTASSSRQWRMYSARRRHAQRLSLRPLWRARARRRRADLHRDDLRLAGGAHQPRLHRHVERRSRRRLEAHRRLRPAEVAGEDLPPARPLRRQGFDQARWEGNDVAARRRQLADHGGVATCHGRR